MPDHYRIIAATPADHETIRQLAHATWPDTFGEILSPAQITYMLEMMYSPDTLREQTGKGHIFHLLLERVKEDKAVTPGRPYADAGADRYRPVGYFSYETDYLPNTTKLHKLYALPEVQGRGYGRAMIEYVAAVARRAGQQKLCLDVNYKNAAIGFYEYLGFVKIDRFDADIGNGYLMEDWRMEKGL